MNQQLIPPIRGAEEDVVSGNESEEQEQVVEQKQETPSAPVVSKEEYDKLFERMQAADRAKSAAEQKAREYEDKDKSELEKATRDLQELRSENEALKEALSRTRIENAFFASNKYKWKNPVTALKLIDLSEVEIDDHGNVKGIDKALEALSKSDPYLLDSGDDEKDVSGANISNRRADKNVADREKLARKYPALRR